MVLDHRFGHLHQLRSALTFVTYPLHFVANLPASTSEWLGRVTSERAELLRNNRELSRENLKLQAELQKFQTLQAENVRLRNLLDASYKVGDRVLIAELIAVDLDPYKQQVVINKGEASGVHEGQAVLDAAAVMGQVVQVTPFSSTVLLITDPSHAIPVQVLRSGLRTIAVGSGRINELNLPYLPTNSDIRVGDKLVTSGLGGKFPPGYPVATISHVNRAPDNAFAQITAAPTAHLDRSREVLLVWRLEPDLPPLPQDEEPSDTLREAANSAEPGEAP